MTNFPSGNAHSIPRKGFSFLSMARYTTVLLSAHITSSEDLSTFVQRALQFFPVPQAFHHPMIDEHEYNHCKVINSMLPVLLVRIWIN